MSTPQRNDRPRGRSFFFNPGPTNIPDSVLGAMHRPTMDFFAPEFLEIFNSVHASVKRVLKTKQHMLMYASNGHGAWEAGLANLLKSGEKVLVLESGRFSASWGDMATSLGLEVETLAADWRIGVKPEALTERLRKDGKAEIKAILVVHNETSTGVATPVGDMRKAIDAARHPALLLVDTISSLGSLDFRMDDWGVDIAVGGSQKGLMMVTGLAFTGISEKAMAQWKAEAGKGGMRRSYWDWSEMLTHAPQRFPGTTPVHLFFGLEQSLKLMEEEGLDAVFRRHSRFAKAVRAAVSHWGEGKRSKATLNLKGLSGSVGAIELLCADPARASDSVSAIMLPDGIDGNLMRKIAQDRFNLSLGGGLGPLAGKAFRIGHMGDLNEPMLLGALATVELAMRAAKVPHKPGAVNAAIDALG
ncbi:MAG TPA: aminotransferase class V-fold PLP-dependent enzyme [Hyphomicrobiaceae bacterium]|nr:aminotransferase class V-fold PLP-dependent enzyme [Hyphomicrobiaceae bacterium]